ncbi:hypothetical protein OFM39_30415, partial [Escherichia coli]|nr:hypothetical protein [Escherichia coli]
ASEDDIYSKVIGLFFEQRPKGNFFKLKNSLWEHQLTNTKDPCDLFVLFTSYVFFFWFNFTN